jgi:hypothetical protein
MAKMFYTESETSAKLIANPEELKQLIREGRLREFRDGPRLMFKSDQVEDLRRQKFGQMVDPDSVPQIVREPAKTKVYSYEGMSSSGAIVKGTLDATSQERAIAGVRSKGIFPTRVIESKSSKIGLGNNAKMDAKIGLGDKAKVKQSGDKQPLVLRLFKASLIFAVGFIIGFAFCFCLLAK